MSTTRLSFIVLLIFFQLKVSAQRPGFVLNEACKNLTHIAGKKQNSDYLYATAGNRLYCIGDQGGRFPKVGFHVPGEMGGIWQLPIKLLDGFTFTMKDRQTGNSETPHCDQFTAYPFLNQFLYSIQEHQITITQTQFVPDNLPLLVVEYVIRNNSAKNLHWAFTWKADINLMPVWLGERIGIQNGVDRFISFDSISHLMVFKDDSNSWYAGIAVESNQVHVKEVVPAAIPGKGISASLVAPLDLAPGASALIRFYISGSTLNITEITQNIFRSKRKLAELFEQKKSRYETIDHTAEIHIPDTLLQTAYIWGKYNTDWLRRDVPGLGKGLSAGLPDYPWFFSNDQASTFMALTGTVQPPLFYDAFSMLKRISDQANDHSGRMIHEVSANGVVYDKGKMQESQLHIIAAWQIFKWTGNIHFLKENYLYAQKTWAWLQKQDTDHNGYIEGYGGVEIEGLNAEMLDVQVSTWRFLDILSRMAVFFGDRDAAKQFALKADNLKGKINREWWVDSEELYADFLSNREKALQLIDDALAKRVKPERNKWAQVKLTDLKKAVTNNIYPFRGYLVYYNAGTLQPVVDGMTDTARALGMIKKTSFFTNRFGSYITGIERPDDLLLDERSFQKDSSFSYNRAVMPAATAGLIIASARYGLPDTALMYIHRFLNTFSYATPGTTYEVSPDYGMFVQAWNVGCLNIPLIQYFFGIDPDAVNKEITMQLRMPDTWNRAILNNLLIGHTKLSVNYSKNDGIVTCTVWSKEPGWKIHFLPGTETREMMVNNKVMHSANVWIKLGVLKNMIRYRPIKKNGNSSHQMENY